MLMAFLRRYLPLLSILALVVGLALLSSHPPQYDPTNPYPDQNAAKQVSWGRVLEIITAGATTLLALFAFVQVYDSRKSSEQQARAFVFVGDFESELAVASDGGNKTSLTDGKNPDLFVTRFAAAPKWSNSGETPTQNLRVRVNWTCGDATKIGTYDGVMWQPIFIGPKASVVSGFIEMPGLNAIIQNGMPELSGEIPGMFIWGCADYRDVFRKSHFVRWCYWVRPERHRGERLRAHFIQWGAYNDSGEGCYPNDDGLSEAEIGAFS